MQHKLCGIPTALDAYLADPALPKETRAQFHSSVERVLNQFNHPITVGALLTNSKAIRLYRKLGFSTPVFFRYLRKFGT